MPQQAPEVLVIRDLRLSHEAHQLKEEMAMYEARKISNFLLARFDARRVDLTNLRLNKLLYFIHATSLTTKQDGLIRNHFEAWQYGPVLRPVFDSFKLYGDQWIQAPAEYLDYASGVKKPIPYDDISLEDAEIIINTFEEYSRFSTSQLVALSHEKNSPWDIVYRAHLANSGLSPRIPNDLIRRHFTGRLGISAAH